MSKALEITPLELERIRTGVDDAWLRWLCARVMWRKVGYTSLGGWVPALAYFLLRRIYEPSEDSKPTDVYQARLLFRLLVGRADLHGPEVAAEFQRSNRDEKDSYFLRLLANAKDFLQSPGVWEPAGMSRFNRFILRYWDSPHPDRGHELFRFTDKDLTSFCEDIGQCRLGVDPLAMKMRIRRLKLPRCHRERVPYSHKVTFCQAQECRAVPGGARR